MGVVDLEYISHPLIKENKIESRLYQKIIAAKILKNNKNTMIVAPTALGKTVIAILVAAERLHKYKNSRVLILAPSKPLALQHHQKFKEFMIVPTSCLTGDIPPKKRVELWENSRVICATPQTIESDLIRGNYSLKDVSLVVFDECHRAVGSYSYVYLASKYLEDAENPLIIGLTASPGSDKEKINEVCKNLSIDDVIIKTEKDKDVSPYFNPIETKWVKVKLDDELIRIKKLMEKSLKRRLKLLKRMDIIKNENVTKKDLLDARKELKKMLTIDSSRKLYTAISLLVASINIEHALELLETQTINALYKYLERLKKKQTKASRSLVKDIYFRKAISLVERRFMRNQEHPKLNELIKILKKEIANKNKVIVFTQFRDSVEQIHKKCQENNISSVKFYGQRGRDGEKGLSQKEQKEIIKKFKAGVYDVLISTSVAEEGIDIPAVDTVILYEPVPSEIRMIQRRGRTGRKRKGKMIVLISEGTRDEAYYWSSIRKENKMKKQLKRPIHVKFRKERKHKNKKEVVIYADSREYNSGVLRELTKLNAKIKIRSLAVADYQVSDEVGIERKTVDDFINSIIDKRLYKQAERLTEEFTRPVLILEGKDLYSRFMNPNAIRGALASIALDFNIPIIPSQSPEDTAAIIYRIAVREQLHEKREIPIRTERKPLTLREKQLYVIESLPHIGAVNAKKLLRKFGSVKNVINASEKELMKVEGIGEKIAKDIKEVTDSKFEE